jgi:hypothetical protein
MNLIKTIKNEFKDVPDLIQRKIKYKFGTVYLFYIETVSGSDRINNYILKNLTNFNNEKNINNLLAVPNLKNINKNEIENYIYNGYTILVYLNKIYALETKAELDRAIDQPKIEQDLYGPKDALIENYQKNIGLIKRRIKSTHLKTKEYKLGRYTQTQTGVLYIDNIVKKDLLKKCDEVIQRIDTDKIIDAGELKQFLGKEGKNVFPAVKLTERPDAIVDALLSGKIAIIVDNSPFALILPAVLADFINPISDNYIHNNNINFVKVLRLACFFLTILTPAFYVAIISYNQETIPPKLLVSFITQRQGVPFPATIEAFFMLFVCEMLKESDIRFPTNYGSSISVLGALILGESAVAANIVSPIMIIIIALTFISSMMFSNVEIVNAVRVWRFICLMLASFYGLYGISLAVILLTINLCSYYSYGLSYSFPVAPLGLSYLKETLLKGKKKNETKRSSYLTNNIRKQR